MTPSGDYNDWWVPYPNLGEHSWEDVDDMPPDEDTTYCFNSTTDNKNTFWYGKPQTGDSTWWNNIELSTETADIMHGVQVTSRIRRDAGDEAHFYHIADQGENFWIAEPTNSGWVDSTSYKYYISIFNVQPSTGSDWTRASIDSYAFGVIRGDYPG
jgi:hypothetical protein